MACTSSGYSWRSGSFDSLFGYGDGGLRNLILLEPAAELDVDLVLAEDVDS